ncbi:MAG: DNA-3-methyladenine glycosylase I [Sporomusaceae bacterium]|nr:DNA-3-methyladenine glycosylase I [Sporomusaceae bacterium]
MLQRCAWARDELEIRYHDEEWGVPCYDDHKLFEMLILEGMQAGLSWITVLKKRENFRQAFDGFDAEKMALYDETKVAELLGNAGIIRNRLKIAAAIENARRFLAIQEQYGSFSRFIWQFVDAEPLINHWPSSAEVPASTPQSDLMSKALRKAGFKFVGTTICYAFMQATGMVNDHVTTCFLRQADKKSCEQQG